MLRCRHLPTANNGLTEEHWRAFFVAHLALNERLCKASLQKQRVGPEYAFNYNLKLAKLEGGGGG